MAATAEPPDRRRRRQGGSHTVKRLPQAIGGQQPLQVRRKTTAAKLLGSVIDDGDIFV